MDETISELLDLRGLKCPMPALLLRRALRSAAPGAIFEVIATDPLSQVDLPFAAAQSGAEVLSCVSDTALVTLRVRK